MQNVFNPLVGMYQMQLEASRRCADAIFSGTAKIDRVMIGATHRAFNEQLNFVQALADLRDPRAAGAAIRSRFMTRSPDEAMNDQKEIMRIFIEMQNEIGQSMQECMDQLRRQTPNGAQASATGTSRTQRQTEAAFNPVTSMFSVWESAFKEVAALARKNMLAGRASIDAASNAAGFAGRIAEDVSDNAADMASSTNGDDADDRKGSSKRRH